MAKLWRDDLLPFRRLLSKLKAVKLSYAAYKAYDFDLPITASCSRNVLQGLLRVKLGYRGLAIADHFGPVMESVRGISLTPPEELDLAVSSKAYVAATVAGCDMQVVCTLSRKSAEYCMLALASAVADGSLSGGRLGEALRRIQRVKRGLRQPSVRFSGKGYDQLCRKIEEFRKQVQTMEREIG